MIDKLKDLIGIKEADEGQVADQKRAQQMAELEKEIAQALLMEMPPQRREPDLRSIGLFADVSEERIAELIHAVLYLNEVNQVNKTKNPITFYLSTYGGSADDMFGMYDIMRLVRENTEIHTVGLGKVMSAGVILLAAGTKGKRKIGANCRVMIHSVIAGNHGPLHNLINEMEAVEQIQQMYIDCLVAETKLTKKQLKKLLERKVNVYLSAEEAVEYGIADIII